MNYLAAGLSQGFEMGSRAVADKRRRTQQQEEAAAERALRRELQDNELTARAKEMVEERAARSIESEKARQWHSGESEADRGFRRGERIDSQGFQSSEAQLGRLHDVYKQDKQLAQQKDFRDVELPLLGARVGLESRKQAWDENPENPINRVRNAAADAKAENSQPALGGGIFQKRIDELQGRIDQNRLQQAQGDMRTGLFNLKSRDSEISDATKEMERIRALQAKASVDSPSALAAPKTFGNKPGPGGLKPGQTARQGGITWRWDGQRMVPVE